MFSKTEREAIAALIKREVVPAIGCTEPIAVALCVARARELLGTEPERIEVRLSANILKNAMGVGIPGTGMIGLPIAIALGALVGRSEYGLEVLKDADAAAVERGKRYIDEKRISVDLKKDIDEKLYIEAEVSASAHRATAVISGGHTNFVCLRRDGEVIEERRSCGGESEYDDDTQLTLRHVYDFAMTAPIDEIRFILESARLNKAAAEQAFRSDYGHSLGKTLRGDREINILGDSIFSRIISYTAAACDARMAGAMIPVMSNSGSGNQGITCTMPVVACAIRQESSDEDLARALMMSHLTSIHIKHHLGRLSAHCGAMVAATAAGCGIALLLDGDLAVMERTIRNMVGNVAGMICDGAKSSCALKVATAVGAGIQAVMLALDGSVVPGNEGITDDDIEVCIANLGRLGSTGMKEADKVILDIMLKKS